MYLYLDMATLYYSLTFDIFKLWQKIALKNNTLYNTPMTLNSSDESLDWLWLWNKVAEQSEQQREEAASAIAWIARTQKDEKKAAKYDILLSELVKKLLQNSVYDHIINQLVPLLNSRCPSHILLGYLLILSDEYLLIVRKELWLKQVSIPLHTKNGEKKPYTEPLDADFTLHLNIWIETLKWCITLDPSQTATKKIQEMINTTYEEWLIKLSAHVLAHFLYDWCITIEPADAAKLARWITNKMLSLVQWMQVEDFYLTDPLQLIQGENN